MVPTGPPLAEENAGVVRRLYDAAARGDLDALADLCTEDAVFHVPGRSRNTGAYHGPRGLADFLASAHAITQGTLRTQLHRVLADDEWAVALATYTATRPDRAPLENNLAHVLRLRDGRVAESWFHSRDQYEVDAFWGAPDDVQLTDDVQVTDDVHDTDKRS